MDMSKVNLLERERHQKKIEEILYEYRDFVLRNTGNLYSEDEKDRKLIDIADEIMQILYDK
ncbi:MAG: hypothetical protein A2639_01820 [Candidatus Staskawiczbacteria bacterium RIFCSPHIGHO2_01_FULL_34_27]|uniref:Uncharacterized protein n=2 Tax=Candidatus Staskawicziibacteriota TaxID=1817916 RepID=A0A1G2HLL3_9BACT|nr:MAG: hypothetical protein A2639_01820 [Candidatus Staskawiczbacteria bacterium RIFCSPHIGHO2_01_FULL_34_27]OGZ69730.1 MAG: hypothetical protein A3D35_02060 [Candidatus Staskawiczbacteria bacterium RIFCSPHIGHO2_02_FULL_34_9]